MKQFKLNYQQSGTTLIELVISIVIISVCVLGVISVMNVTTSHSSDPLIRHQAIAIAQSYMEEIHLHNFCDPEGGCGCTGTGGYESSRDLYDNICDYNDPSLATQIEDQEGNAIAELSEYSVNVTVAETAFEGIAASEALKVEVTVTHNSNLVDFKLTSFKTKY